MSNEVIKDKELHKWLIGELRKISNAIVRDIMDLNEKKIQKVVYDSYSPSIYDRSYEFLNAWSKDKAKQNSPNSVQCTMYYDGDKMSIGWPSTDPELPGYGKHASAIDNFDAREYLADIIYQGLAGPAFGVGPSHSGEWAEKRDAWKALEDALDDGQFDKIVQRHLRKAGFNFKKI